SDYALSEKAAISALESFGWSAGLACYPMAGSVARRASVPGTISLARVVGISLRSAVEDGKDPLAAVLEVVGGKELLRGTVDRFDPSRNGVRWPVHPDPKLAAWRLTHSAKAMVRRDHFVVG